MAKKNYKKKKYYGLLKNKSTGEIIAAELIKKAGGLKSALAKLQIGAGLNYKVLHVEVKNRTWLDFNSQQIKELIKQGQVIKI